MVPSVSVFCYILEDKTLTDSEVDFHDGRMMSVIRSFSMQGFKVNNFQDRFSY